MTATSTRAEWSKVIFDKLTAAGVTLFPYVPDFGNDDLVKMAEADNRTRAVLLSSEQEGVALCAGADLVGDTRCKGQCLIMRGLPRQANRPGLSSFRCCGPDMTR